MPADSDRNAWIEISALLDEAFELSTDARAGWLAGLRSRDISLYEKVVGLLDADERAASSDFLAHLPTGDLTGEDAGSPAPAPGRAPGENVGPYMLMRELGRGGMGTVWLAERSDGTLKRAVALKLPHTGRNERAFLERFDRERDILAGLTHPNIARLYDAGVMPGGQPYLALEYVDGEPIAAYCDRKGL